MVRDWRDMAGQIDFLFSSGRGGLVSVLGDPSSVVSSSSDKRSSSSTVSICTTS